MPTVTAPTTPAWRVPRPCDECATVFTPRRFNARFCSLPCRETVNGTCIDCAAPYSTTRNAGHEQHRCAPCQRAVAAVKRIEVLTQRGDYGKPKPKPKPPRREPEPLPLVTIQCKQCNEPFDTQWPTKRTCSQLCHSRRNAKRYAPKPRVRPCRGCNTDIGHIKSKRFCPPCDAIRRKRDHGGDFRKRARKAGVEYTYINKHKVYDHDNWMCGICQQPVDPQLAYPHPKSASLDHITPLAHGGPHLPHNVQCAHLDCNIAKGDTLPATPLDIARPPGPHALTHR